MQKKIALRTEDFMTVGIYTSIYFVILFVISLLGYMPIFNAILPVLIGIFGGVPFILFLAKSEKFGMITLSGVICGLIMMLMGGNGFYPLLAGLICGLIADVLFIKLRSNSFTISLSYAVFSLWTIGMYLPIYIHRTTYFSNITAQYGVEYANTLNSYIPDWTLFLFIFVTFIASLIGGAIGTRLLSKHFMKSGIV
ncbi:MptD family putative ECF transporter S component [Lysinibacillus sp. NPDC093190]|uniref:MptD family putative ECF transporter S component n=1 Tax=Lysinibacillus sp. NPDC093190 TaxID=3390575 RepID=UPI003CFEA272